MTDTATQRTHESRGRRWSAFVFGVRPTARSVDLALVVVRAALAWIFFVYGAQKLFGWFNGPGIHETSLFMADTAGLRPGGFFAVAAGVIEFGGALAVAFGLLTRLAGLALFVDMVMAMVTVTCAEGLHQATPPGYELNVALAALGLVVALLGAGRYSVDAIVERRLVSPRQSSVP
jgi:putative oxidoreductase